MKSDTTESALEAMIVRDMTAPGSGWLLGDPKTYDRVHAIDLQQLGLFLTASQPSVAKAVAVDEDSPTRKSFLDRLQGEITKRGVIDVLRNGVKHGAQDVDLFYGRPSPGNKKAADLNVKNRFTVIRQLKYSRDETQLALDLCLTINGLPVHTFELKNNLTKQTVEDAVAQYKKDRDQRELLFQFGRCIAHFAVDDQEVRFCTELKGAKSWFLPFNQGWNGGAGNPPNPHGLKTDYLWKEVLSPASLTDIIEHYAQIVEARNKKTGKVVRTQMFPRYHQLDVVRKLVGEAETRGVGASYLIQHAAGGGKSGEIAWLVNLLVGVLWKGSPVFDSIIVVTDRIVLDKQIRDTIRQFTQVRSAFGHAERSGDLRRFIEDGKKIIVTTVQKFPFILNDIGDQHRDRRFAIVIDEAHSSQSGKTAAALNETLSVTGGAGDPDESVEDRINRIMESRKRLPNATYYAFTATPKNKTLELFGEPYDEDGKTRYRPFHVYTMKQAIEEGFILDVLKYYTPVHSYYRLVKTVKGDPDFDIRKATKKLRRYVENHEHAVRLKSEIMVDYFLDEVIAARKIDGQARAMLVTGNIERTIQYFFAFKEYLAERKSAYLPIVAFSGEVDFRGQKVTEASLNGFPSSEIEEKIQEDPYRFLLCADKFQQGYDEPLLHTMFIDKLLAGPQAVQTLSRLNRAHPAKHDVFVLDFANDTPTIQAAFADYYRTTILSERSDPNKLHDLKAELDGSEVYTDSDVDGFVQLYLSGASRDRLDPILDACVATYKQDLDEDGQVTFKGNAKAFVRLYSFLAAVLSYVNASWEKLSIFLNFLVLKLPAPKEDDLSRGILETIDLDSYRAEKQATVKLALGNEDGLINPVPVGGGSRTPDAEVDRLSNILKTFNELFGNIQWKDADRVHKMVTQEIPAKVAQDKRYQNAAKNNDKQNARIELEQALKRVMTTLLQDDGELFKQFSDNDAFRRWLADTVFDLTYEPPDRSSSTGTAKSRG